jgi:cytochrome c-type biogenesis protein
MTSPTLIFSFLAGLLSVLSPCVLPVIPIIIAGRPGDSKLRPLLIVFGVSLTFILMGILTTLFGQFLAPYIASFEKMAGFISILFGILFLFDINLFKKINLANKLQYNGSGIFSGLILGLTLGLIWVPCVGPVLASILAMVATTQTFWSGVFFLIVYSAGFSIPLLLAGYSSHFFRENIVFLKTHPRAVRITSSVVLILFGIYILKWGMLGV